MKELFDMISRESSKMTTTTYSTSFSLGIKVFSKKFHDPIYAIYGFVRFADEIVDSFHGFDKPKLLKRFTEDTYQAIEEGISLNPILNNFQATVNKYKIDRELIELFLRSMEMDLTKKVYETADEYKEYILGSADVVGLMCLRVFCEGDNQKYEALKPRAMRLGSAFQKINFLRDLKADHFGLGRTYFPGVNMKEFDDQEKRKIEDDIQKDFDEALIGIKQLPKGAKFGVYVAYVYFYGLLKKIRTMPASRITKERVRISDTTKYALLITSYMKYRLGLLN
jgi:15-cis-phytoene synthase